MSDIVKNLEWRYATKQFDADKKISDSDLETLRRVVQLTATSYGLQLFKVIEVEDEEIRQQLQPASWGQSQIVDASNLWVFTCNTEVTDDMIDGMLKISSETTGAPLEKLKGYGDFMKSTIGKMSKEQQQIWLTKQTYIALGKLMTACAELKIDSTPMEGFEVEKYNEILKLDELGHTSTVVLAMGYRSEEDQNQRNPKVRRSVEELFIKI